MFIFIVACWVVFTALSVFVYHRARKHDRKIEDAYNMSEPTIRPKPHLRLVVDNDAVTQPFETGKSHKKAK